MTSDSTERTPDWGFAPPTQAGDIQRPRPNSAWPKVIGAIAIVFGVLGALGGLWSLLASQFVEWMATIVPEDASIGLEAVQQWQAWAILSSALAVALAVLLLVAGIGLVRRHRWAIGMTRLWAVLKMVLAIGNAYLSYLVQHAQFEAMAQQSPSAGGMAPGFTGMMALIFAVAGVVWGWALPVFILIWFSRGKIKSEVAEWP